MKKLKKVLGTFCLCRNVFTTKWDDENIDEIQHKVYER